jgi:Ferritin-like domain
VVSPPDGESRRGFLSGASPAAAALALAGCGASVSYPMVKRVSARVRHRDVEILNQALDLERRTVEAYIAGIPLLNRADGKTAKQFLNEELEHTGELLALIKTANGKAIPRAGSYELGHPRDGAEVLTLLHELERLQIAGYLDAIPRLSPGPVRAAVATILASDAEHIAILRLAQGAVPAPSAFVTGTE